MDDLEDCPPPLEAIAGGADDEDDGDDGEELPPLEMLDSDDAPPALDGGISTDKNDASQDDGALAAGQPENRDDEPTPMEMMMAEATQARQAKQERQAQERKKMDKSFGEGMNLKEAFKKKPKKKTQIAIESDSEDDADDVVELGADGFDISEPQNEALISHQSWT